MNFCKVSAAAALLMDAMAMLPVQVSVSKHLAEGVAPVALLTGTCFNLGLSGSATSSTRMSLMLLCVCM